MRATMGRYNSVVSQGKKEVNNVFMSEIKLLLVDISKYECIVLGSPVWWYTFNPGIKIFLSQADLKTTCRLLRKTIKSG